MTNAESSKRPTHRIYAVRKSQGEKNFWVPIGAAWANRDGKGFSLKIDLLPLDGSDIVLREAKPDSDNSGNGGAP